MEGARIVFLDTVKQGEYDSFKKIVDLGHDKSPTTTTAISVGERNQTTLEGHKEGLGSIGGSRLSST
jgi:hypothetical protein